jgi:hypothetical protein
MRLRSMQRSGPSSRRTRDETMKPRPYMPVRKIRNHERIKAVIVHTHSSNAKR